MASVIRNIVFDTNNISQTDNKKCRTAYQEDAGSNGLTVSEIASWEKLVQKGLDNSLNGLSQLLGHHLKLDSLNIETKPFSAIEELAGTSGSYCIGTCLSIEGDIPGQLMLVHTPDIAFRLIDLLLDLPSGTTNTIGKLERCALEDIGNITGSYFLNTMADNAGLFLMPSPPKVIIDSLAAIMNMQLEFVRKQQKEAILVEATFSADHQKIDGTFIALPTLDFIRAVTGSSRKSCGRVCNG